MTTEPIDFGPFTPTHRLQYERPAGGLVVVLVEENNGDLYTREEWDANVQPDWSIHCESGDPVYKGYFARDCFRRVSLQSVGELRSKYEEYIGERLRAVAPAKEEP